MGYVKAALVGLGGVLLAAAVTVGDVMHAQRVVTSQIAS